MEIKITFEQARKRLPSCCAYDPLDTKTAEDCYFLALHEKDMYDEDQDGHCTKRQYQQVCKYLKWLKAGGII